jgi:hypothetical protein
MVYNRIVTLRLGISAALLLGCCALVLGGATLLAGCQSGTPTATEHTPALQIREVDPSVSPMAVFEARAEARGLETIEAAEDGRVVAGTRLPVPPQSSARLLFDARFYDEQGHEHALPFAQRIQDARFAPAPARVMALLDVHGVLYLWEGPGHEARRVDEGVFPGFAFSGSAAMLAYSKGQAPELDVYRYELATGQSTRLTHGGAPVWGFGFAPGDGRIVYVDSREGFPSLMTMAPDGSLLAKLTNRGMTLADVRAGKPLAPMPDGRRPPLWSARATYVEDVAGVHAFDGQGRLLLSRPGAYDLHRGKVAGTILFREGDRYWSLP